MSLPIRTPRPVSAGARPEVAAQPAAHVGVRIMVLLSVYWVAIGFLWQGLHTLILPDILIHIVNPAYKGTALGFLQNAGLILAMVWQPVIGAISDHTSSRWGRRRPYIFGGTLLDIPFLIGLALAGSYGWLVVFYVMLQLSSNTAHGPFQALMPDVVPEGQRGTASGYYGFANMIGLVVGVGGTGLIAGKFGDAVAIGCIAVAVVLAMVITVVFIPDKTPAAPGGLPKPRELLAGSFARPVHDRDFMWITLSRLLILMALIGLQVYLYFFFYETWFPGTSSSTMSAATVLIGIVAIVSAVVSLPAGMLSDRLGHRVLVMASGALGSLGFIGLVTSHYVWIPAAILDPMSSLLHVPAGAAQAIFYGLPIGIGMGAFMTINWAQMTAVIPESLAGAYMGFFNIATAGAGIAIRLIAGPMLDFFNAHGTLFGLRAGYPVVFAFCGLLVLAGGAVVFKARETGGRKAQVA